MVHSNQDQIIIKTCTTSVFKPEHLARKAIKKRFDLTVTRRMVPGDVVRPKPDRFMVILSSNSALPDFFRRIIENASVMRILLHFRCRTTFFLVKRQVLKRVQGFHLAVVVLATYYYPYYYMCFAVPKHDRFHPAPSSGPVHAGDTIFDSPKSETDDSCTSTRTDVAHKTRAGWWRKSRTYGTNAIADV